MYSKIKILVLFYFLILPIFANEFSNEKILETRIGHEAMMLNTFDHIKGEYINPQSRTFYWELNDVFLPTNGEFPIRIDRSYAKAPYNKILAFESWALEIPRIQFTGTKFARTIGELSGAGLCEDVRSFDLSHATDNSTGSEADFSYFSLLIPEHAPKQLFLKDASQTQYPENVKYVTHDNWVVRCVASADANGAINTFEATSPTGVRYTFDAIGREPEPAAVNKNWKGYLNLYVTQIVDTFGNKLTYQYQYSSIPVSQWNKYENKMYSENFSPFVRPYLDKITSSDGQSVTLQYEGQGLRKRVDKIIANNREWNYKYSVRTPGKKQGFLNSVTNPDNKYIAPHLSEVIYPGGLKNVYGYDDTEYDYFGVSGSVLEHGWHINGDDIVPIPEMRNQGWLNQLSHVETRTGLTIDYTYTRNELSLMPIGPEGRLTSVLTWPTRLNKRDSGGILSPLETRTVSGAGLEPEIWEFSKLPNYPISSIDVLESNLMQIIIESSTNTRVYDYFKEHAPHKTVAPWKDGLLVGIRVFESNADIATDLPIKETAFEYSNVGTLGDNGIHLYGPNRMTKQTVASITAPEYIRLLTKSSTTVNNTTYQNEVTEYDDYFNATSVTETFSGDGANRVRYRKFSYLHDTDSWRLNLPNIVGISNDGVSYTTVSEITYQDVTKTLLGSTAGAWSTLLPNEEKSYGVWQKKYSEYHNDGNIKKIEYNQTLEFGATTSNRYQVLESYKQGQPQTIKVPNRLKTGEMSSTRVVDDNGWITSSTDFNGNTTGYQYDDLGQIKSIKVPTSIGGEPSWLDTVYTWSHSTGKPIQTIQRCTLNLATHLCSDSAAYITENTFDGLLRPVLVKTSDGSNTVYQNSTYNPYNQPTFQSYRSTDMSESSGVTYDYDALQRQVAVTQSAGGTVTNEYLPGNKIRVTDAGKNAGNVKHSTTTTYLAYGSPSYEQATRIESPERITTGIVIDIFGNTTSITQSGFNGSSAINQTEYRAYDSQHHLCQIKRGDVGTIVFKRNVLGEALWQADGQVASSNTVCNSTAPKSSKVSFQYDNLGEPYRVSYGDGMQASSFTKDNNGNLKSISGAGFSQSYNYNSLNLLEDETLTIDGKALTLDYGYNKLAHLTSLKYPDGSAKVSFAPNGFGQATQAIRTRVDGGTDVFVKSGARYYPNGLLNSFTYGNNITHKTALNSRLLPQQITDVLANNTIVNLSYSYDHNNNLTSIINTRDGGMYNLNSLSYDGLDRLISTDGSFGSGDSNLSYDGLGNIRTYQHNSNFDNHNFTYQYDSSNRLTAVNGSDRNSFGYDTRGNVTSNGKRSFNYNLLNQMKSSGNSNFVYDGFNRRIKSVKDNKDIEYSMYSQSGKLLYRETKQGGINYILLGSKLVAKEGSGVVSNSSVKNYKPFGEAQEGSSDDVGYTGHKFDTDLGLSYMQARYYDPVIGRFYSNDPVGFTGNPHSFNRYSYVNNNPYKYTDPDGKLAMLIPAIPFIAEAIGATIAIAATAINAYSEETPDFITDSNGTTVAGTAEGVRDSLEGAGYEGEPATETQEEGTTHKGVKGKDGEMDVRVMDGQSNSGKFKGPRVITTNSNNNKDPVKTNGEKFRNNESKGERRQGSHIQLEKEQ